MARPSEKDAPVGKRANTQIFIRLTHPGQILHRHLFRGIATKIERPLIAMFAWILGCEYLIDRG